MSSARMSLRQRLRQWTGGRAFATAGGDVLPVRLGATRRTSTGTAPIRAQGFDQPLFWVVVTLLLWGLVMVYSASIALPESPRFAQYTPTYFLLRHTLWLMIAFTCALLAYQIPLSTWQKLAPWLFLASLILLALVLVPSVGKKVYGARRWISLGPMSFQPSELVKFTVLLYAASYMVRKMHVKERFLRAVLPMGVALALVGGLLLAEPDMGAFLVIAVIAMGILFLGGVNARMFFLIVTVLLVAFSTMIATSEFRRERIFAYLDPWSETNALAKGYQLTHSLIAIGRGEIFGVGLGGSVEKLNWLPEAHTDFLFAVIAEEFGLIGVLLVIALFLWLVRRMMYIGRQAIALERVFAGLVAQGVAVWMGFQAFINMGVNLGALPTKGLTLPLMSYGGSAILINMIAIAVVLKVDQENRTLMQGGRV